MRKIYIVFIILIIKALTTSNAEEIIDQMEDLHNWRTKPGGMVLQNDIVKEGSYAVEFQLFNGNIASKTGFTEDWSQYDALTLWMYCEEPNDGVFGIALTTLKKDDPSWNYFLYIVKADWKGWKHFVILKEEFRKVRDPDWSQIHVLTFSLEWNGTTIPSPKNKIIIDDIRLLTQEEIDQLQAE